MTTRDEAFSWLDERLGKPVTAEVRVVWGGGESALLRAVGVLGPADEPHAYRLTDDGAQLDLSDVPAIASFASDEDEMTIELTPGIWLYVIEVRPDQKRPAGRIEA